MAFPVSAFRARPVRVARESLNSIYQAGVPSASVASVSILPSSVRANIAGMSHCLHGAHVRNYVGRVGSKPRTNAWSADPCGGFFHSRYSSPSPAKVRNSPNRTKVLPPGVLLRRDGPVKVRHHLHGLPGGLKNRFICLLFMNIKCSIRYQR